MRDDKPYVDKWLAHWRTFQDPDDAPITDQDSADYVLLGVREKPHRIDVAFTEFPNGDQVKARFENVLRWAGDGDDSVKGPNSLSAIPDTDEELLALVEEHVARAKHYGAEPWYNSTEIIRTARVSSRIGEDCDDRHDYEMLMESLDDRIADHILPGVPDEIYAAYHFLHEPLWFIECSFEVQDYVCWAFLEPLLDGPDPTEPLMELWRRNTTGIVFPNKRLRMYAPLLSDTRQYLEPD